MAGTNDKVRLRDTRKAGYCWQDNELYDVFQPIIGAYGVNVYVHLTRHAAGTAVSVSLRELAGAAGIGKDTVRRALLGMELVGMIRRGAAGAFELVDLKELAAYYGGSYDFRRRSYVISAEKTDELRDQVRMVQAETQGKKTGMYVSQRDESVSERDSARDAQRDTDAPPERQKCLAERHATSYMNTKTKTKANTPLPPSQARGGCARDDVDEDAGLVDAVICALGVADPREERRLRAVLLTVVTQERAVGASGLRGEELQEMLVEAWNDYCRACPELRWTCLPRKFFASGLWRRPETWPYRERPAASREATVGMYRGPA